MRANGYTIVWKDLLTKPEFKRLAKRVSQHATEPLSDADAESRALGYLTKLWLLADSHIADDDTLDMGPDEVDQFLGIAGLSQVLGPNWLEILDADQVRLPNWLEHNGVKAKKRARTFARNQRYAARQHERNSVSLETQERLTGNGATSSPIPSLPIPSHPIPSPLLPSGAVEQKRSTGPVQEVFEHWKTEHGHPKAQLDPKRKRRITEALKHFSAEQLCQAISGYLNSPHHMGTDPKGRGMKYDDIELFLRDTQHVEVGLDLLAHPPLAPQENAEPKLTWRPPADDPEYGAPDVPD